MIEPKNFAGCWLFLMSFVSIFLFAGTEWRASPCLHLWDTFPLVLFMCLKAPIKLTYTENRSGTTQGSAEERRTRVWLSAEATARLLLCLHLAPLLSLLFPADLQSSYRSTQPPHLPVCLPIPRVPPPSAPVIPAMSPALILWMIHSKRKLALHSPHFGSSFKRNSFISLKCSLPSPSIIFYFFLFARFYFVYTRRSQKKKYGEGLMKKLLLVVQRVHKRETRNSYHCMTC